MKAKAEELWARVLAELRRRGLLPLRSEPLTPQEIAEHLRTQEGDRTVFRFVHEYLYPTQFGQTRGLLGEPEAEALVTAFERGRKTTADSGEAVPPKAPMCRLCNHRPAAGSPS